MAEEHGEEFLNLTCLRGESRLKSETLRGVIHILSRYYELPKETTRGDNSTHSGPGGGDHQNTLHLNEPDPATVINLDATKDICTHDSQHGDDQQMHFSMDYIENFLMDIDGIQEPVPVNVSVNQKALQRVPDALLEKEAVEQHLPESSQHENGFFHIVEFDEAAQWANGSDNKCVLLQKEQINQNQQLDEPNIQSGSTNSQTNVHMTNGCDDIEEGEIDDIYAQEKSSVSRENNVDSLQHSEAGADYQHSVEHRKSPEELCLSDFSRSTLVRIVDNCTVQNDYKIERDFQAISDACANFDTVKTVDIPIVTSAETHASLCPDDNRKPVFYGDISEEASQNAQGALQMEKKRGGSSKEKRKLQKRKKRKEIDKKLGVKRMKLPPALMPKAVKVCQHFLKGRCLKGDKCTFSHDATPLTKSEACVHFARNNCLKGDACPYDHQLWKYPCNNYASQGFCNRGNGCLFSHEIPAKEGSQGASSTAEKFDLKSPSVPETSSKNHANSAASISIKPPVQVPKGLSFLLLGKLGSDSFSRRKPSSSSQIADMIGLSDHSRHNVPGTAKTLKGTSKPILAPVTSNNDLFLDAQLDHSVGNKNSVLKACSKSLIDSTSSLDRGLLGLHSLISSEVPLNCVNNELLETSAKEHTPPVSHFSRLGMHSGSSMGNEMSVLKVDFHKEQTSISKSQITDNMHVEAIQAEAPTRVHCFSSDKSLEIKPNQTLTATISKDHESGKKVSIQNQRTHSAYGIPRHSCAEELNTIVSTIPSSCSQGLAEYKSMLCSVQKALIPALSFASKIECETKVPSLGSVGNSQFKKEPESGISSSRSRGSFNSGPVKASAILDFIFGTGGKTQQ